MASHFESLAPHVSYGGLSSLEQAVNRQPQEQVASLVQALGAEFDLSRPPSLGTRLAACLAGIPFIGWCVPSGRQAIAACEAYDQRARNARDLLVGVRKVLADEYGGLDAAGKVLREAGLAQTPRLLTARSVRRLPGGQETVAELRSISRAVRSYEERARGLAAGRGDQGGDDVPPLKPDQVQACAYGALNQALAGPVTDYLQAQRSNLLMDIGGRRELWPSQRLDLVRDFREVIQSVLDRAGRQGLTPAAIREECLRFLKDRMLLDPEAMALPMASANPHQEDPEPDQVIVHRTIDRKHAVQ